MRAWIFSDLHIDRNPNFRFTSIPDADVCFCAGDITEGGPKSSIRWLGKFVAPYMPVVFVPGNHEFYRSSIGEGLEEACELADRYDNLVLLAGDSILLNGYRFIGTTLWTDFGLNADPALAIATAREHLDDYRQIKMTKKPSKRFTPRLSQMLHWQSVADIISTHQVKLRVPTIVITHHAPSLMSVPPDLLSDSLTPTLASRLEHHILEYQPLLWVHGHIHAPSSYLIGNTRVICNPLGHSGDRSRQTFIPDLVINLAELVRNFGCDEKMYL